VLVLGKTVLIIASELYCWGWARAHVDTKRQVIDISILLELVQEVEVLSRIVCRVWSQSNKPAIIRMKLWARGLNCHENRLDLFLMLWVEFDSYGIFYHAAWEGFPLQLSSVEDISERTHKVLHLDAFGVWVDDVILVWTIARRVWALVGNHTHEVLCCRYPSLNLASLGSNV